jgi:hypothetical protein
MWRGFARPASILAGALDPGAKRGENLYMTEIL